MKLRKDLERDARKVTCDLDHIDACIRLFDPPADTAAAIQRYATKHRARKGQMRRFVLYQFKDATAPLRWAAIGDAGIADRQLRTDHGTAVMIRRRVGACLTVLQAQGLIVGEGAVNRQWKLAEGPPVAAPQPSH